MNLLLLLGAVVLGWLSYRNVKTIEKDPVNKPPGKNIYFRTIAADYSKSWVTKQIIKRQPDMPDLKFHMIVPPAVLNGKWWCLTNYGVYIFSTNENVNRIVNSWLISYKDIHDVQYSKGWGDYAYADTVLLCTSTEHGNVSLSAGRGWSAQAADLLRVILNNKNA